MSFDGNRYSVPPASVDATVMVHCRLEDPEFEIRSMTGEVLARHRRRPRGAGAAVHLPEHKAALESTGRTTMCREHARIITNAHTRRSRCAIGSNQVPRNP
ncbi:MAG: hypothetical protein HYU54_03770 [Actinobacteria bacterium]|nr:hypothetical protein [Actinomycetota bacterium]